jgi:phospho-N-acetylmuramoyl-pentapeptide-transferase
MNQTESAANLIKVLTPAMVSFIASILITPLATTLMHKYSFWKKRSAPKTIDGKSAPITQKIYGDNTRNLPRGGGSIVVFGVVFSAISLLIYSQVLDKSSTLGFLNSSATIIALISFLAGSVVGLIDDILVTGILGTFGKMPGDGLSSKVKYLFMIVMATVNGWWLVDKLGVNSLTFPFFGKVELGWLIIPLFIIVAMSLLVSSIIDAFDGLSGGIFSIIFTSYGVIAMSRGNMDLASLCFTVVGAILAFLYFNIPPARFMMSEVGILGLMTLLTIVSFQLDAVFSLLIICLPLVLTTASTVLQLASKRVRGRKLFVVSPIHNLLVYSYDWSKEKVVMRYWVISAVCAILGIIVTV